MSIPLYEAEPRYSMDRLITAVMQHVQSFCKHVHSTNTLVQAYGVMIFKQKTLTFVLAWLMMIPVRETIGAASTNNILRRNPIQP